MKSSVLSKIVIIIAVLGVIAACASTPPPRHPNLDAAQILITQALDKLTAAQAANDMAMGGHAAKARELLKQAYGEINLAAKAANE
jgi:hypothetical protein